MIVDAQFVYTGGPYTEFRGYVFAHNNPTRIKDAATLDAILKRPDFRRVEESASEVRPVLHVPAKRGWPLGKPRK